MKTKIKTLIKESRTLSEDEKQNYLKIIDFLPEKNLQELLAILENEKTAISDINKKYLQNFEELYKTEYKSAVKEEEKEEKNKADEILKNIND